MKHVAYLAVLATAWFVGCTSSRSVLSIAPLEPFSPESEAELLSRLNAELPFEIPKENFITKEKSGRLVGWAVVQTDEQKEIAKRKLESSTTLTLLQVETLTPEFEAIMQQHRR